MSRNRSVTVTVTVTVAEHGHGERYDSHEPFPVMLWFVRRMNEVRS
jgi:hypothetical protein